MLWYIGIYLLFCVFCFIFCIFVEKVCQGYVTLSLLGEFIIGSIIPGLNIVLIFMGISMVFNKYGNKKIL